MCRTLLKYSTVEYGYLHKTDLLSIKISWMDSILAYITKVLLIFASNGFLHQICRDQSETNIRIPLYYVGTYVPNILRKRPGFFRQRRRKARAGGLQN